MKIFNCITYSTNIVIYGLMEYEQIFKNQLL